MTFGTLRIDGQRFRIVPEDEYRALRAVLRRQQLQAKEDAEDLAIAQRRLKDPKRKTIPLEKLKSELGL